MRRHSTPLKRCDQLWMRNILNNGLGDIDQLTTHPDPRMESISPEASSTQLSAVPEVCSEDDNAQCQKYAVKMTIVTGLTTEILEPVQLSSTQSAILAVCTTPAISRHCCNPICNSVYRVSAVPEVSSRSAILADELPKQLSVQCQKYAADPLSLLIELPQQLRRHCGIPIRDWITAASYHLHGSMFIGSVVTSYHITVRFVSLYQIFVMDPETS
ncbi:hypothetical protein J6590_003150 [Homalodisca vitripennis]|nr:hypothetical protein J6590_003150 [Homalodisca vitripennis]